MIKNGRQAALKALEVYRRTGEWPGSALDRTMAGEKLDAREAALATAVAFGTLQNISLLDFYIGRYSSTPPGKLEPKVRDILRVSVYQLLFMDRIPVHAAVGEGVALCKSSGSARASGLVNAVLRRIAENRGNLPKIPGEGTAEYLSIKYSHPLWLARELLDAHGYGFTEAFLEANNAVPPVFAQVNTLKTDADALAARLESEGVSVGAGGMPNSLELTGIGRVTEIPEFTEGLCYVQDEAARRAVALSGAAPGMNVLDACAAPGGKSFAAAIGMENRGRIISCDLRESKLGRITDGARRLGIGIIEPRAMDAGRPDADLASWADVVIADAPCSGLGVIRKKPEIRFKPPEELDGLPEVQRAILDGLAGCVKPGGALLYATCTVRKRENEDVVRSFLNDHAEFAAEHTETLWPHIDKTDGFFICRMRKSI